MKVKMKKTSFNKTVVFILLVFVVFLVSPSISFANTLYCGFDGINAYSSLWHPDCIYGDRAGASYVDNLYNAIKTKFSLSFKYLNSAANESHLRTDSIVNSVDFYAFSGHCLNSPYPLESSMHFYARSSGETWHGSDMENYDTVNARTNEVRFGHDTLKWITVYSCNWLTNNGNATKQENIFKTFEGTTLTMGFASRMYLDSREGTLYGQYLVNGYSFMNAFFYAADYYQPQCGETVIVRVEGYNPAKYDWISAYYPVRPMYEWYKNSPSSYSIIQDHLIYPN